MAGLEYHHFALAAKVVLDRLDSISETECCLVGGMATRLWGIERKIGANIPFPQYITLLLTVPFCLGPRYSHPPS
jgi:hypothetical protein